MHFNEFTGKMEPDDSDFDDPMAVMSILAIVITFGAIICVLCFKLL